MFPSLVGAHSWFAGSPFEFKLSRPSISNFVVSFGSSCSAFLPSRSLQSTAIFFRAQSISSEQTRRCSYVPLRCHRDFLVVHFLVVPILVLLSFLRVPLFVSRFQQSTVAFFIA